MAAVWAWICANIATIIICALLIAVITLIIVCMIRDRKKGKHSFTCGGSCGSCPMGGTCHGNDPKLKSK